MRVEPQYDPGTNTLTYLVWDEATRDAVVIDPLLDFDPAQVAVRTSSIDALQRRIAQEGLTLRWILETHVHADHLSGAAELRGRTGAPVAIGARISAVQATFAPLFDLPVPGIDAFDRVLEDGEELAAGSLRVVVLATPGHTPACVSYRIGDALFVGDCLFLPDYGVGRCDFPGGDAETLYRSVQRIYALPPETRIFVGHDYQPGGRPLAWQTTVAESRAQNVQLWASRGQEDFVAFRRGRDATLSPPRLLLPSLQVNIHGGRLPEPHPNGRRYLVLPLTL